MSTRAAHAAVSRVSYHAGARPMRDLLDHHGGHAAAAGFTIRNELVPELLSRLRASPSKPWSGQSSNRRSSGY